MDKVQKNSDSECYIPSSEPFRICISFVFENVTHDISNNDRRNACDKVKSFHVHIYSIKLDSAVFKSANAGTDFYISDCFTTKCAGKIMILSDEVLI